VLLIAYLGTHALHNIMSYPWPGPPCLTHGNTLSLRQPNPLWTFY